MPRKCEKLLGKFTDAGSHESRQTKLGPNSPWHLTANQTSAKRTEQKSNQKPSPLFHWITRSFWMGTGVGIQQSRGLSTCCYLNSLLTCLYRYHIYIFKLSSVRKPSKIKHFTSYLVEIKRLQCSLGNCSWRLVNLLGVRRVEFKISL